MSFHQEASTLLSSASRLTGFVRITVFVILPSKEHKNTTREDRASALQRLTHSVIALFSDYSENVFEMLPLLNRPIMWHALSSYGVGPNIWEHMFCAPVPKTVQEISFISQNIFPTKFSVEDIKLLHKSRRWRHVFHMTNWGNRWQSGSLIESTI